MKIWRSTSNMEKMKDHRWVFIRCKVYLSQCENRKFLYHSKIISWYQFHSKTLYKKLVFTEIFQKSVIQTQPVHCLLWSISSSFVIDLHWGVVIVSQGRISVRKYRKQQPIFDFRSYTRTSSTLNNPVRS